MTDLISQERTPTALTSTTRKSAAADYWQSEIAGEYIQDESGEPFLFSFADSERIHLAAERVTSLVSVER